MSSVEKGDADRFKVPSTIPQDLLLIHDLVGGDPFQASSSSQTQTAGGNDPSTTHTTKSEEEDADSIGSSSSEDSLDERGDVDMSMTGVPMKGEEVDKGADSEEEVEAGLLSRDGGGDPMTMPDSSPENSDSDTSDSGSDADGSSDIEEFNPSKMQEFLDTIGDEDDEGGGPGGRPATTHEVPNEKVIIPDITEVDPEEILERVGEVLNILQDKIVIVKGLTSQIIGHTADRVLDTETLLVFEDRKVLGYVHETFGPTYQPLYQVRFNENFPLDKERAQISSPVFHVPARSNFVFVDKLGLAKGSDASNAHDEEPGDDEVEFSDDEREVAYKRMMKERRSMSRVSSRATTPNTPVRRDHDYFDDTFGGSGNPYDEYGAYNMSYGAGPSRPPPIPYDDPYSDSFTNIPIDGNGEGSTTFNNAKNQTIRHDPMRQGPMDRDSGWGANETDRNSSSGPRNRAARGRGKGGVRGRRGRGKGASQHPQRRSPFPRQSGPHDHPSGLTSPSGFAHAYGGQSDFGCSGGEWSYGAPLMTPQQAVFGFGLPNALPGVQPHINPRFANQLGFDFSQTPEMPPSEQYHPDDVNLQSEAGQPQ